MTTGVQYQITDTGMTFELNKDAITGDMYWTNPAFPNTKFRQVFVPLDFQNPAIVE